MLVFMGVSTLPFSFLSPTENFKPISACHLLLSCSLIFTNAEKDKSERSEEDELNEPMLFLIIA